MKFFAIVSITLCLANVLLNFDKRSLTRQLQVGKHKRRLKILLRINFLISTNKLPTVDATFPRQRVFAKSLHSFVCRAVKTLLIISLTHSTQYA